MPIMTFSFDIINWELAEIRKMDTKVKKQIICHKMHHPKTKNFFHRERKCVVEYTLSLLTTRNTYVYKNIRLYFYFRR